MRRSLTGAVPHFLGVDDVGSRSIILCCGVLLLLGVSCGERSPSAPIGTSADSGSSHSPPSANPAPVAPRDDPLAAVAGFAVHDSISHESLAHLLATGKIRVESPEGGGDYFYTVPRSRLAEAEDLIRSVPDLEAHATWLSYKTVSQKPRPGHVLSIHLAYEAALGDPRLEERTPAGIALRSPSVTDRRKRFALTHVSTIEWDERTYVRVDTTRGPSAHVVVQLSRTADAPVGEDRAIGRVEVPIPSLGAK